MTIHFAAARNATNSPVARVMKCPKSRRPANDVDTATSDLMLYAALRHFSEYGLSAPQEARAQAKAAFFAGDRKSYDWWLEICRRLDKRMARELSSETESTRA
ncbi:hypothetical protein MB02_15510 [Croceicoccus estronivorus]|uniref:hypothetical protein n=1 Tax=Croceicoccus estronivorus TaxID=1172626 RepID=UPI0008313C11|nr:hypothetical protein [Croceicoccus estronivorus]OCC22810.1 hypothetical protein MB02_15510 [Croceicoccus estronivorus]